MFIAVFIIAGIIAGAVWFSRRSKKQRDTNEQPPGPTN